ncbi:hypothetical protein TELCIR_24952 [Teladorsagia circumcincta]|uniref:Major facilitator superfamily (MFS) profile domain-containing protein n=1 Tax=Teladorsagia circumcincta TaxID=45464 RepID=A0A2G9T6W3_TELCI|nr:hypothetical protein TELCIR_24952 [Teladorsagia circumcincta]
MVSTLRAFKYVLYLLTFNLSKDRGFIGLGVLKFCNYGAVYYPMSVLVFGFGASVMNIAVTTLYSEIIGPRRQGTLQGVFQMTGSIGSMLAPLVSSTLYTEFGPQVPWLLNISQISVIVALWVVFRRKMVPLQSRISPSLSSVKEER